MGKKLLVLLIAIVATAGVAFAATMTFSDVPTDHWGHDAVEWNNTMGIMTGPGDMPGMFDPNGAVNRVQLATTNMRMYEALNAEIEALEARVAELEGDETEEVVEYTDLTPEEASQLIDDNPELVIIDVSPNYEDGHLPGAVSYYLGDGSLDDAIPELDSEAMYLVYCHVESASREGAQKLVDAGFENVYRLDGDYQAWVDAGYDVEM